MICSKSSIPRILPASFILFVTLISSLDGIYSPDDGWLCDRIIDAELDNIAALNTSLG